MDDININPTKGSLALQEFAKILRFEDASDILAAQQNLLSRLEKTNAMLKTVNELSNGRLDSLSSHLRVNTRLLVSIKRELAAILKRTDSIKKSLMRQYPSEYEQTSNAIESAWRAELEADLDPSSDIIPRTHSRNLSPLVE